MMRNLLFLITLLLFGFELTAQTSLQGKITDAETGEGLIGASILIIDNGRGTVTDFDGNYSINPLDPGTYEIEFSYTGYGSQRKSGVVITPGKTTILNMTLDEGVSLQEVVVTAYEVPLVEADNTTQGQTITSEQIRNLPTRNINALAATTAGLSSVDEGEAVYARGARDNSTDYYVDGIRVSGALIPESEIDQLQVITGGVEARYGDATGALISITTKGPSQKWSGGIELETSEFFDAYDNRLIGFNASGPLLKKKGANGKADQTLIGIRLSGRYTYQLEDDPPATDIFRVKDDVLAELEANPLVLRANENGTVSPFVAAEFTDNNDINVLSARPFEDFTRYDLLGKIDARLSDAIDVTLTGSYNQSEDFFTPSGDFLSASSTRGSTQAGVWSVFNSHNNPADRNETSRFNFRFRHRLGGSSAEDKEASTSSIQNASYTLQFGYENTLNNLEDSRHGDNLFEYGHIGNFDVEWIPTFAQDPESGGFRHTDYRQILRNYEPGDINPVLANYNNVIELNRGENGELNEGVPGYILFQGGNPLNTADISLDAFIARNGFISNQFDNAFGFQTNVGWVYNRNRKRDNDLYTFIANSSFELVPGGNSEKGRHNIEFGVWYEQRTSRTYSAFPRNLWVLARQQANSHIQGIAEDADSIGFITVPNIGDLALLELTINEDSDNTFYRRVREVTGDDLRSYVNVDALSPDQLSLDMFSAKELNDEQILDYFGYDYLGNEFNGTFDDFFTSVGPDGARTFPVAPNRPIYWAGYIQDKFTFKDIIFRVGLRVDQYDANTKVLKDNYSLYEIQGAADFHSQNENIGERPGNIGDDFKVYTNDGGDAVQAYRDGDDWFFANGTPANSPIDIFAGGLVFPAYADERVDEVANFIKNRDFDPNVSFEDYEPQINWMPRLAFSFPISEEANFFANYDILVQRPQSNTLATAYDYFYFTDINTVRNNPNLLPERTITYEVGFQQQLSQSSALKLSAYYREMRDMIQRRTFFPVPIVNQYTTFDNLDFGTVKAFTVNYDLRRTGNISINANYTLQFADGTGSDADSQRGLTARGNIRNLIPLNFDERHNLVGIIDYRYKSGSLYNGPRIGGVDVLSNFGVNLQLNASSGRPYTATLIPQTLGGTGFQGAINGARRPWVYTVNLRVDKSFKIGNGLNGNAYVRVSNLLDRQNVISVYSATGSPTDDGYLASSFGQNQINNIQSSTRELNSFLASYQWRVLNPDRFSLPRRIFAGLIFNF
ncbi:MAG: carboxypeptidase-like regulatory domain-containing protein [Bacteroidota bacterium]